MLTAILKSKTISGFALSYLLGISMTAYLLVNTPQNWQEDELLYAHWAFGWLESYTLLLPFLGVLTLLAAAIISRLRIREARPALGNSNLAMVAFLSFVGVEQNVLLQPDVLLATLLTMGTLLLLLSTYKRESVLSEIFHVGLLIGLAALFVGQTVLLVISVLFCLTLLRTGNWKEWVVLTLGLIMTALFVLMFTVWHEQPLVSFQWVIKSAWSGNRSFGHLNAGHLALVPIFILSFLGMLNSLSLGTVAERNIALANIGWVAGCFIMALLVGLGWQKGIIFGAFPLSIFVSKTLEETKRWWLADLLLLAIIAAPFLSNLWQL